jgi:hypothetical protein
MSVDESVFEEWLCESRGGYAVALAPAEKLAFLGVFRTGDVTRDMFVTKASQGSREDARDIWTVVLDEVDKELIKATGNRVSAIKMSRLIAWASSVTEVFLKGGSPPLDLLADAAAGAEEQVKAKEEAATGQRETPKRKDGTEQRTTPAMKADMLEQGASRPSQLSQTYISCQLGRVAGYDEYEGLAYLSHWSSAKGMKQVAKNPSGLGPRTLAQLLEVAKVDGNLMPVDKFIQRAAEKFMAVSEPMWTLAGSRLLSRWTRAKSFRPEDGRVAAMYLVLYWDEYPGRGIPEVQDYDIIREAERAVGMQGLASLPQNALSRDRAPTGPPSAAGSSMSWASGVSDASTKKLEDLVTGFVEKMGTQMSALASEVSTIKKGHGDLLSRIGQIRSPGGAPGGGGAEGRKCYLCGEKGHQQAQCPLLKQIKATKKDDDE